MHAYKMQGTPTLILIDRTGHIRLHKFGHVSDLTVGFSIGALLSEEIDESSGAAEAIPASETIPASSGSGACDADGCGV